MEMRDFLPPASGQVVTAEGVLAFGASWEVLEPSLKRFARLMVRNVDDRKDLLQDAMVELWNLDPTRYDFRDDADVSYIRRRLIMRMWSVWGGDPSFSPNEVEALVDYRSTSVGSA